MDGFTTEALLQLAGVAVGAGVAGGILAGLLGVGGGIVIVPALYFAMTLGGWDPEITMKIATATSLTTIIFTAIASSSAHYRRGAVDTALLRRWGPSIVVGAILGGILNRVVSGHVSIAVFATVALLVSLDMMLRKGRAEPEPRQFPAPVWSLFGVFTGGVSVLMGIGGGTVGVPLLSFLGYDIRRAVGTSTMLGFLIGIPGTVVNVFSGWGAPGLPPFSIGYVNLVAAAVIIPLTMVFSQLGAKLAHTIPRRALRLCFGLFLLVTAGRMFLDLASG